MRTLPGSGVPSMTTVLPDGGADCSGLDWTILVGAVWYAWSLAFAVATPSVLAPEDADELRVSDESEDPHADNPAPITTAPASAKAMRRRRAPRGKPRGTL